MFERTYVNEKGSESSVLLEDVRNYNRIDEHTVTNFLLYGKKDCDEHTFYDGITQRWNIPKIHQNRSYDELKESDIELFRHAFLRALEKEEKLGTEGSFLSGGLDTSTIVSYTKLPTYSAVYEHPVEEEYIDIVVKETGVKNTKIKITCKDIIKNIDETIKVQEEPFRSTSVIAEYLIYKNVGKKRLFCGQGSDELLGGYEYMIAPHIISTAKHQTLATFNELRAAFNHNAIGKPGFVYAISPHGFKNFVQKRMKQNFFHPTKTDYTYREGDLAKIIEDHIKKDSLTELLNYAYKNTRVTGTQIAMPFLDEQVMKTALGLPMTSKIHKGKTKYILRKIGEGVVPKEILNRKRKMGFSTPEDEWMRGELGELMLSQFNGFNKTLVDFDAVEQTFMKWRNGEKMMLNSDDFWRFYCFGRWEEMK